jgi:hypothetical protein
MPDQNQPATPNTAPPIPSTPPVEPAPRPNFVAFEETTPVPTAPAPSTGNFTPPPPSTPQVSSAPPSGGGGKKIFIILGTLLLILTVLGIGAFVLTQRKPAVEVVATPVPTPVASAYCSTIKAYDATGNLLSSAQLAALQPGDIVRFAASGITTTGTIDSARFTINNVARPEVTTKVAGTDEFYDEYQIPEGTTSFDVTAEVHMMETDTWY